MIYFLWESSSDGFHISHLRAWSPLFLPFDSGLAVLTQEGELVNLEMRLSFFFKINIKLHTPNSNIKHLYEVVSAHKYEINIKLSVFKTVAMIKSLF